jgi:integrase
MYKGDRNDWLVKPPKGLGVTTTRYTDEELCRKTALLVAEAYERLRQKRMLDVGKPTIAGVIDKWMEDQLRFMGWKEGTRNNAISKFNRIKRELGDRRIDETDSLFITEWIQAFCHTADTYNKWLDIFLLIWTFAVSRKMVPVNEAAAVIRRSNSLVVEANQKVRHPLTIQGFQAIREQAPSWLQLAMDIALVTLQGRSEVCSMRHDDFREGYLFVIREKTSTKSDAAFIKIKLTDDIRELRSRALRLDNFVSPFLVHRSPKRRKRAELDALEHWTEIRPQYLTDAFQKARDASRAFTHLRDEERPTFHEIRGLGARICEGLGMADSAVQVLMAHSDKKTTEIYLRGGREALRDSDFVAVEAPMTLAQMVV